MSSSVLSTTRTSNKMNKNTTTSTAALPAPAAAAAVHGAGSCEGDVPRFTSFDDMPLHQSLLRGIYSYGFEAPSDIQQRAIVPFTRGGDILAQAPSGTGKTGAFSIGLLSRIDPRSHQQHSNQVQALVLAPTRELADQTCDVIRGLGAFVFDDSDSRVQLFAGGTARAQDIRKLMAGVAVAVGTPGRIADLVQRCALRTNALRTIVLDEADEMLSQGFADQVYDIFKYLPKDVQVGLFSATVPQDVLSLTQRFMRDPTQLLVEAQALSLKGIKQFYVAVDEEFKLGTLMDLYESVSIAQSVIFASKRDRVTWIANELAAQHHTVSFMHSDMQKGDRAKVMAQFRSGSSRVLIATDLVARGIDVQHVNIVVNFDVTPDVECYLHRIGRSGRFGKKGVAINFVSPREVPLLRAIEDHYKIKIEELPMDFAAFLDEDDK